MEKFSNTAPELIGTFQDQGGNPGNLAGFAYKNLDTGGLGTFEFVDELTPEDTSGTYTFEGTSYAFRTPAQLPLDAESVVEYLPAAEKLEYQVAGDVAGSESYPAPTPFFIRKVSEHNCELYLLDPQ